MYVLMLISAINLSFKKKKKKKNVLIRLQTVSSSTSVPVIQYHSDDPMRKNVMGEA
jgi:hypothetical protein